MVQRRGHSNSLSSLSPLGLFALWLSFTTVCWVPIPPTHPTHAHPPDDRFTFHLLQNMWFVFPPLGVKDNLSLLDIYLIFVQGSKNQMADPPTPTPPHPTHAHPRPPSPRVTASESCWATPGACGSRTAWRGRRCCCGPRTSAGSRGLG